MVIEDNNKKHHHFVSHRSPNVKLVLLAKYYFFPSGCTETLRVKNVALWCVSPPLCDQDAPPTMLFPQHANPSTSLRANIRFLCPPPLQFHNPTITPSCFSSFAALSWFFRRALQLHFSSFSPISNCHSYHPMSLPPTPPPHFFSLPVCSGRFFGSRSGCVNVKPFLLMIIYITRCVSRCPRINTNWRSTLQRLWGYRVNWKAMAVQKPQLPYSSIFHVILCTIGL